MQAAELFSFDFWLVSIMGALAVREFLIILLPEKLATPSVG